MTVYSFSSRSPRDEAALRQDLVNDLHERLKGVKGLRGFSADFRLALKERVWECDRVLAGGSVLGPVSLHDFIHADYPQGLEANYEVVENLIRSDIEALALWTEVTKRKPGEGTPKDPDTGRATPFVDNIHERNIERPTGTSRQAGIRRLQKEANAGDPAAQEKLAEVKAGKKSVHKASVELGYRKSTKIDADVKARAAREVAEMLAEYVPGDAWDALKANLFAAGAGNVAKEMTNITGQSIVDRRHGS